MGHRNERGAANWWQFWALPGLVLACLGAALALADLGGRRDPDTLKRAVLLKKNSGDEGGDEEGGGGGKGGAAKGGAAKGGASKGSPPPSAGGAPPSAGGSPPPGGSPPGGSPGGMPGGMPGGAPGAPGGAPGGAPAGPAGPLDLGAAPPSWPSKAANPFAPLDRPLRPLPPSRPAVERALIIPIRPPIIIPPPTPPQVQPPLVPPDLRTALVTPTGRAIIEQGDRQMPVRPGERVTIDFNGPRQVDVVSVSSSGVTLRDVLTGQLYTAPYRR